MAIGTWSLILNKILPAKLYYESIISLTTEQGLNKILHFQKKANIGLMPVIQNWH